MSSLRLHQHTTCPIRLGVLDHFPGDRPPEGVPGGDVAAEVDTAPDARLAGGIGHGREAFHVRREKSLQRFGRTPIGTGMRSRVTGMVGGME
jgi:hypothetical protein